VATIIFDFDSTLIRCESLEEIVRPSLADDPEARHEYEEMTKKGMEGSWTFYESLVRRLAVAAPLRSELVQFADRVAKLWSPGIPELVAALHQKDHQVWIISGGFREALVPAGSQLGIPSERVLGVQLLWDNSGVFSGVDPLDPFSQSKVAGVRSVRPDWRHPTIMVGDGMTDRALYDVGLVDHFVPFTAWARRPDVIPEGVPEADSVEALATLLDNYLR